ncbi:MAG: hypothetical protein GXO93_03945 [FCB group bacterium]|nr:hypothetical protein [FCB group bacterium]
MLKKIIRQEGFTPNDSKTDTCLREQEIVIAGIRVDNGFDAPSKKIRETRNLIEAIQCDSDTGKVTDDSTIRSIRGKIQYIKEFNPGAALNLSRRLNKVLQNVT